VLTYGELHREVCKAANALTALGVKQGDFVAIYMPMIPEAAVAMLACARIGAPHTVVFGGFSSEALRDRISDAKAKVVAGLQSSLDSVKSQLEAFVPKIQNAPMTQQPALASSLNDVQSKLAAATRQLADLKADYNASNWSKLADDAKASIASLQASVSELVAKVK